MKKIYESPLNSWDERAESIIIYELEEGEGEEIDEFLEPDPDEGYDEFDRREEFLESLGYFSDWGIVQPGAEYERFYIERLTPHHLIISRYVSLNI